jgi:hypothetical protein
VGSEKKSGEEKSEFKEKVFEFSDNSGSPERLSRENSDHESKASNVGILDLIRVQFERMNKKNDDFCLKMLQREEKKIQENSEFRSEMVRMVEKQGKFMPKRVAKLMRAASQSYGQLQNTKELRIQIQKLFHFGGSDKWWVCKCR